MTRTKKAIWPVIALFVFSGIALLLGFVIVMAGLAGRGLKFEVIEIAFGASVFVALVCYGYVFYNFVKQLFQHKWCSLILSERIAAIALVVMIVPVFGTLEFIFFIAWAYLGNNA